MFESLIDSKCFYGFLNLKFNNSDKGKDFIPALNLAKSIRANRPPTKEGQTDSKWFPTALTPIMGSINDQTPLFYEEPHPLTEPETERLVVVACEQRSFYQRNTGK